MLSKYLSFSSSLFHLAGHLFSFAGELEILILSKINFLRKMKEYWFVLVLSLEEEISSISSYITTYKLTLSPTSRRQMEKRPSKESNHFSF